MPNKPDPRDELVAALDRMSTHARSVTHELALISNQIEPAHAADDSTTIAQLASRIREIGSVFDEQIDVIMRKSLSDPWPKTSQARLAGKETHPSEPPRGRAEDRGSEPSPRLSAEVTERAVVHDYTEA